MKRRPPTPRADSTGSIRARGALPALAGLGLLLLVLPPFSAGHRSDPAPPLPGFRTEAKPAPRISDPERLEAIRARADAAFAARTSAPERATLSIGGPAAANASASPFPHPAGARVRATGAVRGGRLWLVDCPTDVAATRDAYARALRRAGYQIEVHSTASPRRARIVSLEAERGASPLRLTFHPRETGTRIEIWQPPRGAG